MKNRQNSNAAYYVCMIIIALFLGCTVEQTHKTLVFFFDGVDKMNFLVRDVSKDSVNRDATAKREALLKKNRPDLCVHQPYKEKKCNECHTPDKRLLMPMPGLCFKCHKSFNETYAVVHGPVASGNCMYCHNQHYSKFPKLLIRQGQQICLFCHSSTMVFAAKVHRDIEDAECTTCHNPHGGKTRFMIKDNISRDANRIALMDNLTYRHLYGQVVSNIAGIINKKMEIEILDSRGNLVATVHPDLDGKFYMANLHPDQNYTFRFKQKCPDCKILIMDSKGVQLFVMEKNRAGKFALSKTDYETLHGAINDAHELGDTLGLNYAGLQNTSQAPEVRSVKDTGTNPENTATANTGKTTEPTAGNNPDSLNAEKNKETIAKSQDNGNIVDTGVHRGKIVVTELPPETKEPVKEPVNENVAGKNAADTQVYKGKIVVKELPAGDNGLSPIPGKTENTNPAEVKSGSENAGDQGKKSKIIVTSLDDSISALALTENKPIDKTSLEILLRRFRKEGFTLNDLSWQISKFYKGTVVCVLNDSSDLIDINLVNEDGVFSLYDFVSFRIAKPAHETGVVSRTIFLNEKMEIIETFNKRMHNGLMEITPNSQENVFRRDTVKIIPCKQNTVSFLPVYLEKTKKSIPTDAIVELDKVVAYLKKSPNSRVVVAAYAGSGSGIDRHNEALRLKGAVDYFVSKGIRRNRIKEELREGKMYQKPGSATKDEKMNNKLGIFIKIIESE